MKNTYGSALALTIFGESHGAAIGAVLDGMAAGVPVDEARVAACMDKRRARGDGLSTARVEADQVQFLSGVVNGHTTGTASALMIENQNTRSGGLNGGISNGMPVVFRTVVKPTPSIYKRQDTVDYVARKNATLSIQGRHDPCIVPRAAIVQTCTAALVVGDLMTTRYGTAWMERPTSYRREES